MRARPTAPNDRTVGRLPLLAGLATLGEDARGTARVPTASGTTFTATHRMADGVHRGAAIVRLAAHPAFAARFSQTDVHVIRVADGADCRPAIGTEAANFAR